MSDLTECRMLLGETMRDRDRLVGEIAEVVLENDRLLARLALAEKVVEAARTFLGEYGETTMLVQPPGACDATSEALRVDLAAYDQGRAGEGKATP